MITIKKMRMKDGRRPPRRFAPNPTISKTKSVTLFQVVYRNLQSSVRVSSRCTTHPSTWHAAYVRQPFRNTNTAKKIMNVQDVSTFLLVFSLLPHTVHLLFYSSNVSRLDEIRPLGRGLAQLATLNTAARLDVDSYTEPWHWGEQIQIIQPAIWR